MADRPTTATLRRAIDDAVAELDAAGIESPRWDAEQLASHVLDVSRSGLLTADLDGAAAERFRQLVAQRAARVPLQHLVGSVGFRYVELAVGPGVFTPRPETELVAGAAIDAARATSAPIVVDLCTGSGAIARSVVDEVPDAVVHAVELDADAVAWARRNLDGTSATLHHADAAEALPELDGRVDVVVCNPPYVATHELLLVPPEVRDHDPHVALVADHDGLAVIRAVARSAARLLRAGGTFVVEHSDRQGVAVPALLAEQGCWRDIADHRDLTGRDRYATAVRKG